MFLAETSPSGSSKNCTACLHWMVEIAAWCGVNVKVILSLSLTNYHAVTTYGGVRYKLHAFWNSALDGDERLASHCVRFTAGEIIPSTHCVGVCDGSRDGMKAVAPAIPFPMVQCAAWNLLFPQLANKSSAFINPEVSFPFLQDPATGPYPEPDKCSPYSTVCSFNIHFRL
jgi:hypothetical protein